MFQDALEMKASDVEKPPLPPLGTYRFQVSSPPTFKTTDNGEYEIINFPVTAEEAMDDVNDAELKEFGDVSGVRNRVSFICPTDEEKKADQENTLYRLKTFLVEHCGMDEKKSLKQLIDEAHGAVFLGTIAHRPNKNNPEEMFAEIRGTAPIS